MFEQGFKKLKQTMRGKGTNDRPYEDYNIRELDISWRMKTMADQFKVSLDERVRFNHYHFSHALVHLGDFGFKDIDIIKKSFDKLNQLLDERDAQTLLPLRGPDFLEELYGTYKNLLPKYYIYDGFQDSSELKQYVSTLLEWNGDKENKRYRWEDEDLQDI